MNSKKILILLFSVVLVSSALLAGCGNAPEVPTTEITSDTSAEGTTPNPTMELASATPTPDPMSMLIGFTTEIPQDVINILLVGNDSDSVDGDGNGRIV